MSDQRPAAKNSDPPPPPPPEDTIISDASAWVLRVGVILSATIMLAGIVVSFVHGTVTLYRIQHDGFDYSPVTIYREILGWHGKGIVEAGIYLLVFTPIFRVFTSTILFALEEHDWLYTFITLLVLIMTLAGLLWLA